MKPLEDYIIASDMDGTIYPNDSIFDLFDRYGKRRDAETLNKTLPGSDISVILNQIVREEKLSLGIFKEIADDSKLFPNAKEFYSRIEELGGKVCIITASYRPIAMRIAERLGLNNPAIIATGVNVSNGFVTGCKEPVMEASEKARELIQMCSQTKTPLRNVFGIGDSPSDRPFMDAIVAGKGKVFWVPKRPDFLGIKKSILEKVKQK